MAQDPRALSPYAGLSGGGMGPWGPDPSAQSLIEEAQDPPAPIPMHRTRQKQHRILGPCRATTDING